MEIISDDRLIETLKLLLNSRNGSMTLNELQRDFKELEGKHVPELKFLSLLKNNSIFHVIRPINGSEERFDIRYDVKAKLNRTQYTPPKKFNPQTMTAITTPRSMKNTTDRSKYSLVNYHNIINTNNNNNNTNNNNNNNQTKNNNPIVELPQKQPAVDLRHKINNRKDIPTAPPKLMMPLSERLKRKGELSPSDILAAESVIIPDKVWDNITLSFYSKLLQYCKDNKLSPPELKFLNNPLAKNTFRCQVTVKDKTYMAYNDSFDTESEAREACCKVALNEINREEELAKYPLDVANDFEIVKKIYGMIKGSIGGVFCKHISALYTDTHQLSIPEHWLQVVKQYDQKLFNFELSLQQDDILFAAGDIDSFIDRPTSAASSIESIETPKQMVPELVFPWSSKLWNVFVTNAYNTNEVCVRLIGESYSDALDDLLNDIDLKMMVDKERPSDIKRNIIYLTSIAECWHRIRVIEKNDNQANCICIDNGDFEWINFDEIYICRPEFLTIAPQAFKISMFGLEDFESHPNISVQLFEPLIFKSLVAEVMITESTFQVKNPISMILYDTSSDEDVNLNETLMSNILSSIPAPTLSAKDNNQITVTHIGDDVIYCQLLTSSNYIQQLINKLPKSDIEKHSGLCVDKTDKKKIYLIYDSKLKNWYRGRMERLMDGDDHVFYYIDQGFKATVNVKDVYRLDKMNVALSLYPQQVIKFSLFSVQLTDNVKKRLLALLPAGRQALVKVVNVANNLPQVQLFTHITHNNETIMIKINDQFPFNNGTKVSDEDEKPIKVDQRILKNNGEFIKVTVTLVLSPQCFGIQLQDDLVAFQTMMNDLQSFCKSNTKMLPFNMVEKGESYAVYVDDEDKWYRASAENIIDDNFIHFYLFDYGHFKMNSLKSLRQLPNIFRNVPKQAMKAKLFGVKPKNKDFTPEDAIYFKELTENKSFPAVIKNISRDMFSDEDIYEIVLFGETRKIHELLIEEKRVLSA